MDNNNATIDKPAAEASVKISRKDHILQCLAHMLEKCPGDRITTAALAKEVGVTEAALYRHFPSKARMFEGLIGFAEETIFTRITRILADEPDLTRRCEKISGLVLTFFERNAGITRIFFGDAIVGEADRLRTRVSQFFDRLETQLKQIVRDAEVKQQLRLTLSSAQSANLMAVFIEGRIGQFVRSDFRRRPTEGWLEQWQALNAALRV